MDEFVLDASVALSWLLEDAGPGQAYADSVFEVLTRPPARAHVSASFGLEVANGIAKAELRGVLERNRTHVFLAALAAASILCDPRTDDAALKGTLELARTYRLSSYDASYLELALRSGLELATLDDGLRRAAGRSGVKVFRPA